MFNIENFDIKLETENLGRNFIYTEEISSTNSYLMKSNDEFLHGTTILSEFQNQGKGRINRPWFSEKGQNLTFSVLLKNDLEKYNPNHISLAASLAVSNSIENLFQLKTELKWPNDVLVNSKKVSGILLESTSMGSSLEKIIIGFGVNVNQTKFIGEFKIRPTSIKFELRKEVTRERLLSEILNTFEEILNEMSKGSKKLLDDWREKCRMIGEHIMINVGDEKKSGIFYDIDANGLMILKVGEDFEKIKNGDVLVR
ncbi:MAG: biotin--[acetyl-CoA-carboxylase] ligase [Ignavibacteriales bacterium]|nr:biotin--[acetyl-CoA-carboxylase] ligase [Ignavibacteriales bacterium]MCB9218050.1 biotin--[acetyl-CoA-carboxylase] ligase [Ignavibacteriales bacterium]MCB9260439.1 biotin--[acetyl-CoA-carboxylase] ligase [Ignavibacteriales bacterium]